MSVVNMGLLGCGTVGSDVVELLQRRMGKLPTSPACAHAFAVCNVMPVAS